MSSPQPAQGSLTPAETALARVQELELRPIEGLPVLVGRTLHRWIFRLVSMIEVPARAMAGQPITRNEDWFRRDRHRHPRVDPETYRLHVEGVPSPRSFSLDELRALPAQERLLVMECAGNGNHWMGSAGLVAQARWRGVALETLLEACGGSGAATHFGFHGLDPMRPLRPGYHYGLSREELSQSRALVAYEMNGEPLPRERGFPVRLVVPGIYSMSHVKWLGRIVGETAPHRGIWNDYVFTNKERRDGKWRRVQARWIGLKSLLTTCRRAGDGWELAGWAWGGDAPLERVEVTTDGGSSWHDAELTTPDRFFPDDPVGPADRERAWSTFRHLWTPPGPGTYLLGTRAHAVDGTTQPFEDDPDIDGHFNVVKVKWRKVTVPR